MTGIGMVNAALDEYSLVSVIIEGNGAIAANVTIEGSRDQKSWGPIMHFEFNGIDSAHNSLAPGLTFPFIRANLESIYGDGTEVTVSVE
jgi:hypothetical protein